MKFKAHKARWHATGGYTLIELMIIIVVIALLVALAVPAYKNYTVRSKITECINGASVAKIHISEYRQIMGPWPPSLTDAGLPPAVSGVSQFCSGFVGYASGDGSFRVGYRRSRHWGFLGYCRTRADAKSVAQWDRELELRHGQYQLGQCQAAACELPG